MKLETITTFHLPDLSNKNNEVVDFIKTVISDITDLDYKEYFVKSKIKPVEQKSIISTLQNDLLKILNSKLSGKLWAAEAIAHDNFKDRFDLSYEVTLDNLDYTVIIELDKCRSDQIAKKFVSRTCHTLDKPTIYFAFGYPGTKDMSYEECKKYIGFCESITAKLSSKKVPRYYVGLMMEKKSKRKTRKR